MNCAVLPEQEKQIRQKSTLLQRKKHCQLGKLHSIDKHTNIKGKNKSTKKIYAEDTETDHSINQTKNEFENKENNQIFLKPPIYDSFNPSKNNSLLEEYPSPKFNFHCTAPKILNKQGQGRSKFMSYRLKTILNYVDILKEQLRDLTREVDQLRTENLRNNNSFTLIVDQYRRFLTKEILKKLEYEEENQILKKQLSQYEKKFEEKVKIEAIQKAKTVLARNPETQNKKDRKYSEKCNNVPMIKALSSNPEIPQNAKPISLSMVENIDQNLKSIEKNSSPKENQNISIKHAYFSPVKKDTQAINYVKLEQIDKKNPKKASLHSDANQFEKNMETIRQRLQNLRKDMEGEISQVFVRQDYLK